VSEIRRGPADGEGRAVYPHDSEDFGSAGRRAVATDAVPRGAAVS
jgi:hypothetical protein